jgi:hypothetical protein
MKAVKIVLKVILALAVPLNAMAFGMNEAKQGLSIESKLELQSLKLRRSEVEKEMAESAVHVQALKEIADPSLMGFYNEHAEDLLAAGGLTSVGASMLGLVTVGAKNPKAVHGGVIAGLAVATGLAALMVYEVFTEDDYSSIIDSYRNSSVETQKSAYVRHSQLVREKAQVLEALDQQIETYGE